MTLPADSTVEHVELRPGAYADSVALLQVSTRVAAAPGVVAAQVAMASPLNLEVIAGMGFSLPEASPNDMVVALRLESDDDVPAAVAAVDAALAATARRREPTGAATVPPRTTASALERTGSGLAVVSVPGPSACVEAMDALDAGRDVMVFSDNVPLEEEVALKSVAAQRGLLVMGPDCGTAVVEGVGLGFANVVRPGPVGIVAASGTGCQQLLALLDHAGVGVTAALGVGGRDLSAPVGGRSAFEAMRRLEADPRCELIVVVSKPPAAEVAQALEAYAASLSTPARFALLGPGRPDLTAVAEDVLTTLGRDVPQWPQWLPESEPGAGGSQGPRNPHGVGGSEGADGSQGADGSRRTGRLRGLFAGGTLCDEAMVIAQETLGPVWSNIPLDPSHRLEPGTLPPGTVMIDLGSDELTRGRAHPMIDPTIRLQHLADAASDPSVAVILLDVVLGHAADADPATSTAPAIARALATAAADGRELAVVVSCIGTSGDPQDLHRQATALAASGARVHLSNAAAAHAAVTMIGGAP